MNEILAVTLPEYLTASALCLNYEKGKEWNAEGCLGFPAALLLFSVVDAIGSYVRGSTETFCIGAKECKIRRPNFEHFFVLNGESYYRQNLSRDEIEYVYDKFRCLLSHNATFTPGGFLVTGDEAGDLFPRENGALGVNLAAFYAVSVKVVPRFLAAHPELERSSVAENIRRSAG